MTTPLWSHWEWTLSKPVLEDGSENWHKYVWQPQVLFIGSTIKSWRLANADPLQWQVSRLRLLWSLSRSYALQSTQGKETQPLRQESLINGLSKCCRNASYIVSRPQSTPPWGFNLTNVTIFLHRLGFCFAFCSSCFCWRRSLGSSSVWSLGGCCCFGETSGCGDEGFFSQFPFLSHQLLPPITSDPARLCLLCCFSCCCRCWCCWRCCYCSFWLWCYFLYRARLSSVPRDTRQPTVGSPALHHNQNYYIPTHQDVGDVLKAFEVKRDFHYNVVSRLPLPLPCVMGKKGPQLVFRNVYGHPVNCYFRSSGIHVIHLQAKLFCCQYSSS